MLLVLKLLRPLLTFLKRDMDKMPLEKNNYFRNTMLLWVLGLIGIFLFTILFIVMCSKEAKAGQKVKTTDLETGEVTYYYMHDDGHLEPYRNYRVKHLMDLKILFLERELSRLENDYDAHENIILRDFIKEGLLE